MAYKYGWFPQRKRDKTYPTCDGCGLDVAAPSPLREDGLVAHDSRCLEAALRKKRGYVHSKNEW
jgi:hypothetical protein